MSTTPISTLVIGGAGYIASYLVPMLVNAGRYVTVLDRCVVAEHDYLNEVTYIQGDFGEIDLLKGLLRNHQEVIHLAYATLPNTSFESPLTDLLQNLPATIQLFMEAALHRCRLVLVSSGGTVYGQAINLPITEDHPTNPISPYGVTKLTLEKYANLYAATHGLNVVCVRPANAYGPGQKPFIGQGYIATALASAISGEPIRIYGEFGSVRDYIHVEDVASGIISAMLGGLSGEIYNLGTGVGNSNIDIVRKIEPFVQKLGKKCLTEHLLSRAFDVSSNVLDASKIKRHVGWAPKIDINLGLQQSFEWMRAHLNE